MIKSQLVDWLADEMNINRREAKSMVDAVLEGISRALVTDGRLTLRGFGTFEVRRRGERTLRPSRAHAQDHSGAAASDQSSVSFRPGDALRSRLEAKAGR